MSVSVGAVQQESELPKLRGAQFDPSSEMVNLFRGSVSFPVDLVGLPGRNGLEFKASLLYQSDQALHDVTQWTLSDEGIAGVGWNMPYERIILSPGSDGRVENSRYFWVMSGQPTPLMAIERRWFCGRLGSEYGEYLVQGPINPVLKDGFQNNQLEISDQAELVMVIGEGPVTWDVNDPVFERSYRLTSFGEGNDISVETGGVSYELYNYQFWRILYYPLYERWEVIKNDGGIYSFGGSGQPIDPEGDSNVLQYGIEWDRWKGPSTQAEGQSRYVTAWNLAKVSNRLGNYYLINYEVDLQTVGEGTLTYTKACRVCQVKNDLGWRVEYGYEDKVYDPSSLTAPKEYLDPHKDPRVVPGLTPDAYQSTYNTRYLSEIRIYNAHSNLEKYLRFGYHNFGTESSPVYVGNLGVEPFPDASDSVKLAYGGTYRRYLESVTEYIGISYGCPDSVLDRCGSPGIRFQYNFGGGGSNEPLGSLRSVLNPLGGYTQFHYEELLAGNESSPTGGSRSLTIDNFWGQGKEGVVRTWSGQDYVVCCWINSQGTGLRLNVYTWWGRWEPAFEDFLSIDGPVDSNALQVIPSQNTFVLIVPPVSARGETPVYLFNRHKMQQASWELNVSRSGEPLNLIPFQGNRVTGMAGVDAFLFLNEEEKRLDFYQWIPLKQEWSAGSSIVSIEDGKTYFLCMGALYYGVLAYDSLEEKGTLTYVRFNEMNTNSHGGAITFDVSIPSSNGFRYCQLSASQSFIAMTFVTGYTGDGSSGFTSFDYDVKIIRWDDAYNLSVINSSDIDNIESGRFQNIPTSVLSSGSGIYPQVVEDTAVGTGPNFLRFDGTKWRCESVGITYEGFSDLGHQYYWYSYDSQGMIATENTDSGIRTVVGSVDPSNPSAGWQTQVLRDAPGHDPDRYGKAYPTQASSFTVGGQIYSQPLSSQWGTLNLLSDLATLLNNGETIDSTTMINGGGYLAFLIRDEDGNPKDTGLIYLKNGCIVRESNEVVMDRLEGQQIFQMFGADHRLQPMNGKLGSTIQGVVSYPKQSASLDETASLTLNRYSAERFQGLISHYVVKRISQSDGYSSLDKCYQYSGIHAAADGLNGSMLKFYEVKEYEGCQEPRYQKNGYTVSHFYNGLPKDLLTGDPIKAYSLLDGQLQEKKIFDASGTEKTSSTTAWQIVEEIALTPDPKDPQMAKIFGAIPQVVRVDSVQEGIESVGTMTYSLFSGNVVENQGSFYDSRGQQVFMRSETVYAYQYYPGIFNQHMLTLNAQESQWVSDDSLMTNTWNLVKSEAQTYKLWSLEENTLGRWGGKEVFVANRADPVAFSWEPGQSPTPEQGWQKMSTVISRNAQGAVTVSRDLENKPSTVVYDDSQTFQLATFGNATVDDGILYESFEDYQTPSWVLSAGGGRVIDTDSYLGVSCYELGGLSSSVALTQPKRTGKAKKAVSVVDLSTLSWTQTLANPNQFYVLSGWYKTSPTDPTGLCLEIAGKNDSAIVLIHELVPTQGEWAPYQWSVDLTNLQGTGPLEVTLRVQVNTSLPDQKTYVRIDQVVFAPVLSPFEAKTYDLKKLRPVGGVSANGSSSRMLYNLWDVNYSGIGPNNQTTVLGSRYSVRQSPTYAAEIPFLETWEPNRDLSVNGRDLGFYDLFRSNESLDRYDAVAGDKSVWQVGDGSLMATSGVGAQYLKVRTGSWSSLSVYADMLPASQWWADGRKNPPQTMGMGVIGTTDPSVRFLVRWNGGEVNQWEVLRWNGTSYAVMATNTVIEWQPSWHLTIIDDTLLFTANGILVFKETTLSIGEGPFAVQIGGEDFTTQGPLIVQNFTVLSDLQLTILYKDGLGAPLQSLAWESSTTSLMTPFVRDELGRKDAINFLPSRLVKGQHGVTDPLAYQPTFITNGKPTDPGSLWQGNPVTGDITFYHADAAGYPFSRTVYESSPLKRPLQSGKPGLPFAILPNDGNPHTTQITYGINTTDPGFLYPLPLNHYTVTTVTDPDGHQTQQYKTVQGQIVGTIRKAKEEGALNVKSSQVYDRKGNRIAGIPPQYYEDKRIGNQNPQTSTIPDNASQFGYDFWGRMEWSSYPDYRSYPHLDVNPLIDPDDKPGRAEVIYDIAGRVLFSCDAQSKLDGYYSYSRYDVLGRSTERGLCYGQWDRVLLQRKADQMPQGVLINTQVKQVTTYDGNESTPWMVGRVWKTTRYNGETTSLLGGGDTATIGLEYTYQMTGEVLTFKQEAIYNGVLGHSNTTFYTYTLNGRLLTKTDSVTNVTEHYDVNRLEQVIETRATTLPTGMICGQQAKTIRATYAYTQEGALNKTTLYKTDGVTVLTDRDFTYLPNGLSQGASDTFVTENLKYTEGRCATSGQGYYNGALAHDTVTYHGVDAPPTYDYCFEVDALNRLKVAQNTDGKSYSWVFDDNSNFKAYTLPDEARTYTTAPNTNQLIAITSTTTSSNRSFFYDAMGDTTKVTNGPANGDQTLLSFNYDKANGKAREIQRPLTLTRSEFDFGPGEGRARKRVYENDLLSKTITHTGLLEIEESAAGQKQTKRGISTQGVGLIYRLENDTFYWILPDHLGSTRMIVDEHGAVQRLYTYDIYGVPTKTTVNLTDTLAFYNLFTGQYWDEELELYNYRARFYDPHLARFLQVDPAHQGFSPYVYVGDMPDMFTDPTGEIFGIDDLIVGLIVAAVIGAVIGSAVSGITGAAQHGWGSKESWKAAGYGAAAGAASGAIGFGVGTAVTVGLSAIVTSTTALAATGIGAASGAVSGAVAGFSGQAMLNRFEGRDWDENVGWATLGGVVGGALLGGVTGRLSARATAPLSRPPGISRLGEVARFRAATRWNAITRRGHTRRILFVDEDGTGALGSNLPDDIRNAWPEMHELLPVAHARRWKALGFSLEDVHTLRTRTDDTWLLQGGVWASHPSTRTFDGLNGPSAGGHPDYTGYITARGSLTALSRATDGSHLRLHPVPSNPAPAVFNMTLLEPIKRGANKIWWRQFFQSPFSVAYGARGQMRLQRGTVGGFLIW